MSAAEQNVLALKTKVPFKPFQVFRTRNVEHGNSSVYVCVFWGTTWFSIITLTQNRVNVTSSRRRKISWMSCEVCGSVRKQDPTHTHIHTHYPVCKRLLQPAVEGQSCFTESYNKGSKRQSKRVRDALDPGLNLTQMEDFSFTWPEATSNTHKKHTSTILRMGPQPLHSRHAVDTDASWVFRPTLEFIVHNDDVSQSWHL